MIGLGTIINVAGILFGGLAGLLFGKKIHKRFQETLMTANAVSVLFLGIGGAMSGMLQITDGGLATKGTMMIISSMALGGIFGELLNIEEGMERFGGWLKVKSKSEGDEGFVDAFLTASLTVCIGAMAVVGAIQDALLGDISVLTAKAVLDAIIIFIMTAGRGKGCVFSAVPVAVFQGSITLLARFLDPVMTEEALANLSLIGSILIFCVGVNLLWGKKVKVANLLPALVFAVAWAFLPV